MVEIKEPTEEQLKEFWEWCGFKEKFESNTGVSYCVSPDNVCSNDYPPVDLNNLFKYAVPKVKCVVLSSHYNGWLEQDGYEASIMWDKMDNTKSAIDNDPALALFGAIWKLIEAEKKKGL